MRWLKPLQHRYWRLKVWLQAVRAGDAIPFAPLSRPLSDTSVALITTAGVHLRAQTPFDCEQGDWTARLIPGDAATDDLMITHTHYDTADAAADPDCVFPLRTLRQLASDGLVGRVSPVHFGLMGYIPQWERLVRETAPEMAMTLRDAGVSAVVLSPG